MENNDKTKAKKADKGRYRYFADYEFIDVPKKNGKGTRKKRVYSREHYSFVLPDEYKTEPDSYFKRIKLFYGICVLIILALWVGASFMKPAGHNSFYVVPAYVLTFIPIALMAFTVVELVCTRSMIFERAFADSIKNLRAKAIAVMIGGGMCAVSEIVFIVLGMMNKIGFDIVIEITFAVMMACICLVSWFFLKLFDSIKIEKV